MAFSCFRNSCWINLGVLRAGMGRLLVLGSIENASLMPWFVLTALLHSIIVLAKREQFTHG